MNVSILNKTGVCGDYAQSFTKVCNLLGIESEVIKGYARNDAREIGNTPRNTNHAWNAVKLNNKWLLLDATRAAGYVNNGKWIRDYNNYFYHIPKEKIFKTHFPSESIWVLRFGRMSLKEFYYQPIYGQKFLSSNATILSPKKGILTIKNSKAIVIKIENLEANSKVRYKFCISA